MAHLEEIIWQAWAVLAQMAPYLLFGFLVAGALSVFITPAWVERHLGGRGWRPILKAALFGVPLPLCSCGVIPVAAGLRRHGASKGATLGFLISTPQTGVDSILVTYGLLGGWFAVFRPVAAFVMGGLGGGLLEAFLPDDAPPADRSINGSAPNASWVERGREALRHGFGVLPRDIGRGLLVGLVLAGGIGAWLPAGEIDRYLTTGWSQMLAMLLLSVPLYVCSTASVPVAAALIAKGISPGAALVFLIGGPATNAATLGMIWQSLGRGATAVYLATISVGALLSGWLLDGWLTIRASAICPLHMGGISWYEHLAGVALVLVLANALWPRKVPAAEPVVPAAADESLTLKVSGMTCRHCAGAVEAALRSVPGVESAAVDLAAGEVAVTGTGLDREALRRATAEAGFTSE